MSSGFAIASWNTILGVFTVRYDWDTDQSSKKTQIRNLWSKFIRTICVLALWASLLTTFTNLGAMLAALFAGNLVS